MDSDKIRVICGGLLHDIGKPVYRSEKSKNHSLSGFEFLKNEAKLNDEKILEQVKYHHGDMIKSSKISDDSLAYITYIADNIASGADRRRISGSSGGFKINTPLESVFNILGGNKDSRKYKPQTMESGINYPVPESEKIDFSPEIYNNICVDIADSLKGIEYSREYVNSLLEIMEADCSFVPSSTNLGEIADISLYDHSKITAAVGSCIFDYVNENKISDFKSELYKKSAEFYKKKAFLMFSFDISGIQDFIYTISSKGTLKMLRSRSFYLEMLSEHFIDTILEETELSRANLIYSGGGHGYLLLANTAETKEILERLHKEINSWCLKTFKNALYTAAAYTECSANDLMNKDEGDYSGIFTELSHKLSQEKSGRYSACDILELNRGRHKYGERECRICHNSNDIKNDVCVVCDKLIRMSNDIIDGKFFAVVKGDEGLPLPFGCSLICTERSKLTSELMNDSSYVRCYSKNKMYTGLNLATKIWVGDYHTDKEFSELADKSTGIRRIGVMRADVDNLGKAFVSGFDREHMSLSRSAVFSRKLSIFFKKHIKSLFDEAKINALIVYSGGDDVFLVSAWSDAVRAAMILRDAFEKFTGGTLTISAGIGIYSPTYPIEAMAYESGGLETASKEKGRNKITLLSSGNSENAKYTFGWDELKEKVIGEKKKCLENYFDGQTEHGRSLLYNLLDYLRNISDKINIARYAYLLSRIEPDKDAGESERESYKAFSRQMYDWAINKEDRLQLIMAIYLYVYETRTGEESEE
ncbi:MAG: type III-A CRISPR-associated protein Cas10/Csm1 [Clostridiales bacterium]|nr:type III-A CRISPR-associated protein Cas10/Csm1 [Clostridiales bacterium]